MHTEMNTSTPRNLIDYYKAIEDSSARMLEAALQEDWDGVVRCEGVSTILIEQLRYSAKSQELTHAERREKTRIMQRILRNDAQIRHLAEPWLTRLENLQDSQSQVLH